MALKEKYDFLEVEKNRYKKWKERGFFACDEKSNKKPFTVIIPPPNVTGKLHIGHALDNTLQDLVIRKKRMEGYDCLYLPGTDHAGIATQARVDNYLKENGTNRFLLGREEFLKQAYSWAYKYRDIIYNQWETMGLSVDYNKIRFTLDEGSNDAVFEVFNTLYKKKMLYRDYRITNFDVVSKTALSNIEVEYVETNAKLYYIKYKIVDADNFVTIATTRPETMFADQALMVNPKDSLKKDLIGKEVFIPLTDIKIPIISDSYVDPNFGTGVVKVTPAHDHNDFLVGKRHALNFPLCMDEDGKMNEMAFGYNGLDRFECRKKLLEELEKSNQLEKIEDYKTTIGYSERTNTIVEPRLSLQWYVKMDKLAKLALNTKVNFHPKSFKKNFDRWLLNCEDWCISRQLWWGHRIPVWYDENNNVKVSKTSPGQNWHQDEDVLDTWFSSALWPFSTLGFPNKKTSLIKRYYPTDLMITGYDIMFFWVARMIFQGRQFMKKDPFKNCLFHGLVRATDGRKMSKSLDNGIDPKDVCNTYGADALRYFLASNSTPGVDFRYDETKVRSSWNLINKLYNITRFITINVENIDKLDDNFSVNNVFDKYIIKRLDDLIDSVSLNYDKYMFQELTRDISNFVWDEFASNYLETSKYFSKKDKDFLNTSKILKYVLIQVLKLLHPIIPFVTDYLYETITKKDDLMVSSWPKKHLNGDEKEYLKIQNAITLIRNIKAENNLSHKDKIKIKIVLLNEEYYKLFKNYEDFLIFFLNLSSIEIINTNLKNDNYILKSYEGIDIYFEKNITDKKNKTDENLVLKRIEVILAEIKRCENILNNENFLKKAKKEKVEEEKEKYLKYKEELKSLQNK